MNGAIFVEHLGHLLAVHARGTSGVVPGTQQQGVRLDEIVLRCLDCGADVAKLPVGQPVTQS
jgi:hypothetical protein